MPDNTYPRYSEGDLPCTEVTCPVCDSTFIFELENPPVDYEGFTCPSCGLEKNVEKSILRIS